MTDVYTRQLGLNVHYTVSPAFFGIGNAYVAPILFLITFSFRETLTNYDTGCILLVILLTSTGFIGQVFLTMAFQLEKAGRIAVITYIQVVNACLADLFVFHMPIYLFQFLGMILIVCSGSTLMLLKACEIIV